MPSLRQKAVAELVLGVLVLVAAVFAPVGAVVPTYQYEVAAVEPTESEYLPQLAGASNVLTCVGSPPDYRCAVEGRVREQGPLVVNETVADRSTSFRSHRYDLVFFRDEGTDGQFVAPRAVETANGSYRLSFESVSNAEILERTSIPWDRVASRDLEPVLERGVVRSSEPIGGWEWWLADRRPIAYEGAYYRPDRFSYRGGNAEIDELLRLLGLAAGIALVAVGLRDRLRARTDSSRSQAEDESR